MRLSVFLLCLSLSIACGDDSTTSRTDSGAGDSGGGTDAEAPDTAGRPDTGPCDEGDPCDADGDGCTQDICRRGRCILGTNSACDDGASCTTDTCRSTGPMTFECTREVGANFCAIDMMCFRADDANPMNACQVCRADSQMAWTTIDGDCDDGNACTTGDTCATGECIGIPTGDAYEENETRADAAMLPSIRDDSTFPAGTLNGTLFPEGDEDWYVYRDTDENLGRIFPRVELQGIPEGTDYELCAYVNCTENDTEGAECTLGTESTFEDLPGCCSNAAGALDEAVRIDHSCDGGIIMSDDTADVFVRVRQLEGPPTCRGQYTLLYGDD